MISVVLYYRSDGSAQGFSISGHAEYAAYGHDVVCAGVSALVIGIVNGLIRENVPMQELVTEDNLIRLMAADMLSAEKAQTARVLLETLFQALGDIKEQYGSSYIDVKTSTL